MACVQVAYRLKNVRAGTKCSVPCGADLSGVTEIPLQSSPRVKTFLLLSWLEQTNLSNFEGGCCNNLDEKGFLIGFAEP
jgi:hypothetical protein